MVSPLRGNSVACRRNGQIHERLWSSRVSAMNGDVLAVEEGHLNQTRRCGKCPEGGDP